MSNKASQLSQLVEYKFTQGFIFGKFVVLYFLYFLATQVTEDYFAIHVLGGLWGSINSLFLCHHVLVKVISMRYMMSFS